MKKNPGEESAEQHAVTRPPWTPSGAHPIGRTARTEDVAATVLWLASDVASFVTGHVLKADGEFTARWPSPPTVRSLAACTIKPRGQ